MARLKESTATPMNFRVIAATDRPCSGPSPGACEHPPEDAAQFLHNLVIAAAFARPRSTVDSSGVGRQTAAW